MSSEHDKAVLNCIFNPLLPISDNAYPTETDLLQTLPDDEDNNEETLKAKEIELQGVKSAESGDLNSAITLFEEAIKIAPNRPSGYNNRAQALRLLCRDEAAFNDLNKAIELSKSNGKSGCQALCQRGLLHRKMGEDDLAKEDLTKAANLGSQFAKQQLIEMNPYAAMCNQMLHEVISKLYTPNPIENGP